MTFQPGQPKPENSGRKPGTPNKNSGAVKQALTEALIAMTPTLIERMAQLPAQDSNFRSARFTEDYIRLLQIILPHDGPREGIEAEVTPEMTEDQQV